MALSQSSSSPAQSSAETLMLLQSPRKWTPRHLEVAKLKANEDVPAAGIVADYVPKDGDPEFEKLAELFCEPSREQLETTAYLGTLIGPNRNPLVRVFDDLPTLVEGCVTRNGWIFKQFIHNLIREIMNATEAGEKLLYIRNAKIPFEVPQLLAHGKFQSHGVIVKYNAEDGSISIPLAIFFSHQGAW
ncbi:hypothetical protein VTN77DRAFT_2863 [Rasamsonia byssochlamydoides]|uniref:uncharacterized protein n=1 Tax=Rasamsonia byssochlamydoides TaxID=89139 RepID=UPI003743040D